MPNKVMEQMELIIKEDDRVAVFIDGYTTQMSAKTINLTIDWKKLRDMFHRLAKVKRISFYLSVPNRADNEESTYRPLIDWLSYNGYHALPIQGREIEYVDTRNPSIKSTLETIMSIDALLMADVVDHLFLFTSNDDFIHLVETLQRKHVVVTVVNNSRGAAEAVHQTNDKEGFIVCASKQLIKTADNFVELNDLRNEVQQIREVIVEEVSVAA